MSDIYCKASLQNTLNPEVGTFDNVDNKEGTFTLEDGEYYLTNNTRTGYIEYYLTKSTYSTGCTVEFDVNYKYTSVFSWCLLFHGDDDHEYWHGLGVAGENLQFRGASLPDYHIVKHPSTWLHVKCIFNHYYNQNIVHIYIDNVEVTNFSVSNDFYIKSFTILGNSVGFVPAGTKIKNIIIYNNSKHYLDTTGLTSLWSKIKSLFATKTELANKANDSDVAHKSGDETIAGTKTFTSTIVGNVTGTATKLATARTIALSGAATGTATGFDGSGNITIPVTALSSSAIRAQWYAAYPDGAEAHNAMWGGRDITAAFDNGTVSANIANGSFKDIFPGDYITKQVTISGTAYTVNWVVADCDYWWHKGDQNNGMDTHHVAIVPQASIFSARMNPTNTAEGGYAGSEMYRSIIPACATGIVGAFGSDHILTFRDHLTHDLNTAAVSSGITVFTGAPNWNGAWYSQQCNLLSEAMVYDGPHCASSALDTTMATRQMSAFRLSTRLINYNRRWWWLRDVVASAPFACVHVYGHADAAFASVVGGVRPFALLK